MTGLLGSFLLLLSMSSYGIAGTFFETGGSLDDPTPVYPDPRIILMGPRGIGINTDLFAVLAGCLPDNTTCHKTTNETTLNVVTYLGDEAYGTLTLVDTPGLRGDGGDVPIITNIIDVLKHQLREGNIILLCLDSRQTDFGPTIQNMITELESLFGRQQVWDHVAIEVTKWSFSKEAIDDRNDQGLTEDKFLANINEQIKTISHLSRTLPGVFIDYDAPKHPDDDSQQEYYQKYTQDLWDMAVAMPLLEFLSIEDILEELSECRAANDCLNEVLEGRLAQVEAGVRENKDHISNIDGVISDNSDALAQVEADVIKVGKLADHNSEEISRVDITVTKNKAQISTNSDTIKDNSGAISGNSDTIRDNSGAISGNSDAIEDNSGAITGNSDAIKDNSEAIRDNSEAIRDNSEAISDNFDVIDAIAHTPVVGVCAYQSITYGTGTITYDSVTGKTTDGSSLSTSTGKYTATTQGLYYITYSASTYGYTSIYLYKDGAQVSGTVYASNQGSSDRDQGSQSLIQCLRPGQEIHLAANFNTGRIDDMHFCVTLHQPDDTC